MNIFGFLKQFILPHLRAYLLGIGLLIVVDYLQLGVPKLIGKTIDALIYSNGDIHVYIEHLWWVGIAILICKYGYRYCILGEMRKVEYRLREAIFEKALLLPLRFFEENGPGRVMALLINDVTSVRVAMGLGMLLLVDAIFLNGFALLVVSHQVSPKVSFIVLAPIPIVLLGTIVLGKKVRVRFRRVQNLFSYLTEHTQDLFLGIRIIKSLTEEPNVEKTFAKVNRENMEGNISLSKIQALYIPVTRILPALSYVLSLYFCGQLVLSGGISIGDFVALNGYIAILISATMGIGGLISIVNKALGSYDRIVEFFSLETEGKRNFSQEVTSHKLVNIAVKNLHYQYPGSDTYALKNISLDIPSGSFIGIVGKPGAGKSTLLNLLMRLYNPPKGTIYFDNIDILDLDLGEVRSKSAYVPQGSMLFSYSLLDNVTFPDRVHSEGGEDVKKMLSSFGMDDMANECCLDSQSSLQEMRKDLSGGQQQRVAIARAIYKDASIFLLDDVLSALDYKTALTVIDILRQHMNKKTVIFVSQRVNVLENADRIYVFENGEIVEEGTHQELWKKGTLYFELYNEEM